MEQCKFLGSINLENKVNCTLKDELDAVERGWF